MIEFATTQSKIVLVTSFSYQNDRWNVLRNMLYKTQFLFFRLRSIWLGTTHIENCDSTSFASSKFSTLFFLDPVLRHSPTLGIYTRLSLVRYHPPFCSFLWHTFPAIVYDTLQILRSASFSCTQSYHTRSFASSSTSFLCSILLLPSGVSYGMNDNRYVGEQLSTKYGHTHPCANSTSLLPLPCHG